MDPFGRLTLDAFKHDAIEMGAGVMMLVTTLILAGILTHKKRWTWLWKEWITTVDPKKIGVMYLLFAAVMLLKGVTDAGMLRAQQVLSVGEATGYLTASHFQQVFSAHGTTMIFFVGMGFIFASMNLILPLQLGARDVAFPFLNAASFWLFFAGGSLLMISLVIGDFSATGWVAYPPLSGIQYSPDTGVDYWIWSVQIAGVGSLLSGINFLVTIFTMRCPGMTFMRMPVFAWSALGALALIIFAFPILTATVGMLTLDRVLGMHFFTADFGGNPMMYVNLIWAWGHPEVYILILPAFGVFSEVVSTYSEKRLFGYTSMVWAIVAITVLSFIVWLHHFFTMGVSANINAFFGIMTMLIAIPTGVKIFNWLFTMYRGRIHFKTPMLWFLGFVIIFTLGGMTGILMSVAPIDFQVHNSLFLIAHFHSMVIGGVLFGLFSAITYWFPKFTGFTLDERLGRYAFYFWFVGFIIAFMPLYALGFMGATRRLDHYEASTGWQPLFIVVAIGAAFIFCGIALQIQQLIVSIKERDKRRKNANDPWNGRTLEWATTSPPPLYNFAILPEVDDHDAYWISKHAPKQNSKPLHYEEIHLPKNCPLAFYIGMFSLFFGFGIIWYMFWLAAVCFVGIVACLIARICDKHPEFTLSPEEIAKQEKEHSLKQGHA